MRQCCSKSLFARVGGVCVVALITSACSSQQATPREAGASEPAPPEPAPARSLSTTLDEVSARCERVQEDAEIPVTCRTDTIDDVPLMVVGFRNMDEANSWLGPFERHIGDPFCAAASQGGHAGRVYMAIGSGEDRRGRRFSCELGQWGEWFPLTVHSEAMRPTLADVVATCQGVQADEELPITCTLDEVAGLPTIIVGFGTKEDTEQHLGAMAERIGEPFCDAASSAGQRALFVVTIANAQARPFDCAHRSWGEWFSIPTEPEVSRGTMH